MTTTHWRRISFTGAILMGFLVSAHCKISWATASEIASKPSTGEQTTDQQTTSEQTTSEQERAVEDSSAAEFEEPAAAVAPPLEVISDFESADGLPTEFGFGWRISTDSMRGGVSSVTMERVEGGAQDSLGALEVAGEIRRGSTSTWAGAKLFLGTNPTQPQDLSDTDELVFWARGDGGTYRVSLFTKTRGQSKTWITFEPRFSWTEYSLPWAEFEDADPGEFTAVMFSAGPDIGRFQLQLRPVAVR